MEALVIMLREGIEAVLVAGIILVYLSKSQRKYLNNYVYLGLIVAVLASIAGAFVFRALGFEADNPLYEGILFTVAAVFVTSMVFWMHQTGRFLKQKMETKMGEIVQAQKRVVWQGIGIFTFTFFMVFREGIETVLFMMAISQNTANRLLTIGFAFIGLALAILFGILFIKGTLKINLSKFFNYTAVVLMVLVVKLLAGAVHEFGEVGILPEHLPGDKLILFLAENNLMVLVFVVLILIPIVYMFVDASVKKLKAS